MPGGDPFPLFGSLPGVRAGAMLACEFQLSSRFMPWPGRRRLEWVFALPDLRSARRPGGQDPPWVRGTETQVKAA